MGWYNGGSAGYTSRNKVETTGVESERAVVRCSQRLETTECKR